MPATIRWSGRDFAWNGRTVGVPGGAAAVMSIFDQFVAIGKETTYGTAVAPTKLVEAKSDDWAVDLEFRENVGFRPNRQGVLEDQHRTIEIGATGSVESCWWVRHMGALFHDLLGTQTTAAVAGASGAYKATYATDDTGPTQSFVVQMARREVAGTARTATYVGCIPTGFTLSCAAGDDPMAAVKFDSAGENRTQAAASITQAAVEPYAWPDFTIEIASTAFAACTGFSIEGDLGMKTDLQYLDGDSKKAKPVRSQLPSITGTLDCHLTSASHGYYVDALGGTARKLEITAEHPDAIGSTTQKPEIKIIIPKVIFTGNTPNMSISDVTTVQLGFKAVWDGSNPLMSIEVISEDAALAF